MSNAEYLAAMAEAKREYERYQEASRRTRPNTRVDSKRTPPAVVVPPRLPDVKDVGDVPAALDELDAADARAGKATGAAAPSTGRNGKANGSGPTGAKAAASGVRQVSSRTAA